MARRGDRGSALVLSLVALVIVGSVAGAYVSVEYERSEAMRLEAERERAFFLAEVGVDAVTALLNASAWNAGTRLDWSADRTDNDGDGLTDEEDESLSVATEDWGSDGFDNDGDGEVDDPDERIVTVASRASSGASLGRVTAWLRSSASLLPEPAGSVHLGDDQAQCRFAGMAFQISGIDRTLSGLPGPATPIYGIAIDGDPRQVTSQLTRAQYARVTGTGGVPSVGSWSPSDPGYIPSIVATFAPEASVVFDGFGGTYTGNLGDWRTGPYLVALSRGDLKIGGGSTGAGILLVQGDLEISGAWEYVGYVVVTGRLILKGGGNSIRLLGTALVGGDMMQPSGGGGLAALGSVDVFYSSEALRLVGTRLGRYQVVAVREP